MSRCLYASWSSKLRLCGWNGWQTVVDKEFTAKTKELLREHTTGGELEPPGAIHNLGSEELEALKGGDASDTTKILNLRKILATVVTEEGLQSRFCFP
jgi:type I restriction enzyme R subunit